jgi:uncharacterized membrane protein
MVGSHYPLYLLPTLFISLCYAFRRRRLPGEWAAAMLVSSALICAAVTPLSPVSDWINADGRLLWYPVKGMDEARISALNGFLSEIPRSASVLTQNRIFPHVSGRMDAYVIPVLKVEAGRLGPLEAYCRDLASKSDYILLDLRESDPLTTYVLGVISAPPDYSSEQIGSVVLARNLAKRR